MGIMAVKKINPQDVYLARIMEQRSAIVRKNAADTIRAAEKHVQRSERIVSQAITILERAEEVLNQVGRTRRASASTRESPKNRNNC